MNLAIASGKGGTGKTTVAIALAETLGERAVLWDCDVEEPNCHLFLPGEVKRTLPVSVMVPEFHSAQCNGCGKCAKVCRFHAIAALGTRILVFPELCHSCGGCLMACPAHAMTESRLEIGRIEWRHTGKFPLVTGKMNVGHTMSVPVIRQLKSWMDERKINLLDAPPGTACPMVHTVGGCDYCILVTEPTPFGLHDLKLAVETLNVLKVPFGVVINRNEEGANLPEEYCRENGIRILMRIPFSRDIAEGYARGRTLLQSAPELRKPFSALLKGIGAP